MGRPGQHPQPPNWLSSHDLSLIESPGPWWRVHRAVHGALYFGRSGDNRFDDPLQDFDVLYVGCDAYCAFIETFGDFRDLDGRVTVALADLGQRRLSQIAVTRAVRVVDLRGPALVRMGADARLWTADYSVSQQWSRVLHDHPSRPDGLLYPARHDPERLSLALFEDCVSEIASDQSLGNLYPDNWALAAAIVEHYQVSLHA